MNRAALVFPCVHCALVRAVVRIEENRDEVFRLEQQRELSQHRRLDWKLLGSKSQRADDPKAVARGDSRELWIDRHEANLDTHFGRRIEHVSRAILADGLHATIATRRRNLVAERGSAFALRRLGRRAVSNESNQLFATEHPRRFARSASVVNGGST